MFIKTPVKAPPGSTVSFEVRYQKGRKPFATRPEADRFAKEQRDAGGWAAIDQIVKTEVEKRR